LIKNRIKGFVSMNECTQIQKTTGIIILSAAVAFCGVLKNDSYIVDEYSKDTFAILYKNTHVFICPDDSVGNTQRILFYTYIKWEDELSGKIKTNKSLKDSVGAIFNDTVQIYQDDKCINSIGKIWDKKGHSSPSYHYRDRNTSLHFYGIIKADNLLDRQPWKRLLAGIKGNSIFSLNRDTINKHLTQIGMSSIETDTIGNAQYLFDYILVGCSPAPIVKAILIYSDGALIAYWTEEKIEIKFKRNLYGKNVYFSERNKKVLTVLEKELSAMCKPSIGGYDIEGCDQK
jgi:hypothetical protein